jgi:hypothetical protein
MLDVAIIEDLVLEHGDRMRGQDPDHYPSHIGTRSTASLHRRSAAGIRTEETCVTSFAIEMHMIGLKIGTKNETSPSANGARKGIMISMAPSTTSPIGNVPRWWM